MKVITEQMLRDELRARQPEYYEVPEGKIISPAAREYLMQRKIKIILPNNPNRRYPAIRGEVFAEDAKNSIPVAKHDVVAAPPAPAPTAQPAPAAPVEPPRGKYVDYDTGAYYSEKPEHLTQLHGNKLIGKDSPRILFRGKLDSMQGKIVLGQVIIKEAGGSQRLLDDLNDVLYILREIMRCDVLDQPMKNERMIGYTHEEIHDMSHNPMKYFSVKQMVLPEYSHGKVFALINTFRAEVREVEVAAAMAFRVGNTYERKDIIETLNRLSSALHIMMCKYLADEYKN